MAFCGDYRNMRERRPMLASEIEDKYLLQAIERHSTPEFWDKYRDQPARYAYIRRWGSVLRREARGRGLL